MRIRRGGGGKTRRRTENEKRRTEKGEEEKRRRREEWRKRNSELVRVQTRNLQTVIAQQLVATAVATGAPVIEDQRVIAGRYSWKIAMPILVKYQSANKNYSQSLVVRVIVQRVPVYANPKGVGIVQFIAK